MSKTHISYQGTVGSFSYRACSQVYEDGLYRGCRSFSEAMELVRDKKVDIAMIPVENSTAGRVMEVYNILPESGLYIVGEYLLPIHHCLMMSTQAVRGLPSSEMSDQALAIWKNSEPTTQDLKKARSEIREIQSHPQGLAQCKAYLKTHFPKATQREVWDTAGAARDLSGHTTPEIAAIAPEAAAIQFGMTILDKNIEDVSSNTTRFLMLADAPLPLESVGTPALTSLIFETEHKAGALLKALQVFERHGINMTKLESYMIGPKHSNPHFYVDIAAHQEKGDTKKALEDLKNSTLDLKILGTYPASTERGTETGFTSAG